VNWLSARFFPNPVCSPKAPLRFWSVRLRCGAARLFLNQGIFVFQLAHPCGPDSPLPFPARTAGRWPVHAPWPAPRSPNAAAAPVPGLLQAARPPCFPSGPSRFIARPPLRGSPTGERAASAPRPRAQRLSPLALTFGLALRGGAFLEVLELGPCLRQLVRQQFYFPRARSAGAAH
jgi:hypothetical protein